MAYGRLQKRLRALACLEAWARGGTADALASGASGCINRGGSNPLAPTRGLIVCLSV
jgi:hypothetical protein